MVVSEVVRVMEDDGDHGGNGGDGNMHYSAIDKGVDLEVHRDLDSNPPSTTYSLPDVGN